jgi:hypothetical protein
MQKNINPGCRLFQLQKFKTAFAVAILGIDILDLLVLDISTAYALPDILDGTRIQVKSLNKQKRFVLI